MSKRRTETVEQALYKEKCAEDGLELLKRALEKFKISDNRQTAERVRLAISSAKGAIRVGFYRIHAAQRRERLTQGSASVGHRL